VTIWPTKYKKHTSYLWYTLLQDQKKFYHIGRSLKICGTIHWTDGQSNTYAFSLKGPHNKIMRLGPLPLTLSMAAARVSSSIQSRDGRLFLNAFFTSSIMSSACKHWYIDRVPCLNYLYIDKVPCLMYWYIDKVPCLKYWYIDKVPCLKYLYRDNVPC